MPHDIKGLEKKITALSNALAKLGKGTDLSDLIMIIKNPGWTTIAEYMLVTSIVDHLTVQVKTFGEMQKNLVAGAKSVGRS
jgi:hypothetical protein